MQTRKTLVELAQMIEATKAAKKDYIVPSAAVAMSEAGQIVFGNGEKHHLTPTAVFHEQLSEKLQIPKKYYDRVRENDPALLAHNVNTWLARADDKRMVRTVGGEARALLSDRYRPLDHDMIMESVLPVLFDRGDLQILSAEITERRLYLQVVSPRITGEVTVGDVVQTGLTISNSEVGLGSVRIEPLLYRLRCLNGMIMATAMRRNHVGKQIEADAADFYRPETLMADNQAFLMKIEDTVKNAFDEIAFASMLERIKLTTNNKIEDKPLLNVIEDVTERFSLQKSEGESVLKNLINGADLSQWGLANAVTAMANTVQDYDRAVEMERIGGRIIDLSPAEWSSIAVKK